MILTLMPAYQYYLILNIRIKEIFFTNTTWFILEMERWYHSVDVCYQLLSTQMSLTIQNITTKPNGLLDVYMLINCWIKIFLKMSGKSFTEGDILSVMTTNLLSILSEHALLCWEVCCIVLQLVAFFPWPAFARIQLTHLPQNWFHRHWSPQEFATSPQEPPYKQVHWITPLPSKMYG